MSKVRQLPKLYLRGSLTTITMPNLTPQQVNHVNETVIYVANHSEMVKYKNRVIREYSNTIAADFRDNKQDAIAEYHIAIWRGVVDLFYHNRYSFKCRACQSDTYQTKRGKIKPLDRVKAPCPNCNMVEITDPGDTNLVKNSYITHTEFQNSYTHLHDGHRLPKYKSTIDPVIVEKKYNNPDEIIKDTSQLKKFFGEYVWNYFRQQLAENQRLITSKAQKIHGTADYIITEEICNTCRKHGINYNYCEKTEPSNGKYTIKLNNLITSPEFTVEFAMLKNKAAQYDIIVGFNHHEIWIETNVSAPYIDALVIKPEYVTIIDDHLGIDNEIGAVIDQLPNQSIEGKILNLDNQPAMLDAEDTIMTIRNSLPESCKPIYDILRQEGDAYLEYEKAFGVGDPKINNIAELLQVPTRIITSYRDTIRAHCLYYGLVGR